MPDTQNPQIYDAVQNVVTDLGPNQVSSIAIAPSSIAITGTATQQLTITATMKDGSTRDVTALASYNSATPAKATVNAAGLVTGVAAGTSVITVTYDGQLATKTATIS